LYDTDIPLIKHFVSLIFNGKLKRSIQSTPSDSNPVIPVRENPSWLIEELMLESRYARVSFIGDDKN
jgi:hypothetical protein